MTLPDAPQPTKKRVFIANCVLVIFGLFAYAGMFCIYIYAGPRAQTYHSYHKIEFLIYAGPPMLLIGVVLMIKDALK